MLHRLAVLLIVLMASLLAAAAVADETPTDLGGNFAARLVEAARQQIAIPAIYDPSYREIPYPGGDVPWYFGVCTDVVVRAYRALGIDLQPLVHTARVGSGDRNIDHRRVPVLARFFARYGKSLPISADPKNFLPGDIVTYHVPDGTFSKTHIVIVSDRQSWIGVPLVIHNRGYGVQEEDWLFADRITGHYRFQSEPNMPDKIEK